jgi:hypothetical protein
MPLTLMVERSMENPPVTSVELCVPSFIGCGTSQGEVGHWDVRLICKRLGIEIGLRFLAFFVLYHHYANVATGIVATFMPIESCVFISLHVLAFTRRLAHL